MNSRSLPMGDDFLLSLVHDIRAYVRKSLSGMQLIDRSIHETLDSSQQQRFEQVIGANKELDTFLGRLSDYANAAHGGKARPLPLFAVVQSAALRFPANSIQMDEVQNDAMQTLVNAEMIRLFTELLDNALKFSSSGPVSVQIERLNADKIQVSIRDSGIGIPTGEEDRVFDLLIRLQSKDEYPGFGLGLPICKRIADVSGASVSLTPNFAGGTIARVVIPISH